MSTRASLFLSAATLLVSSLAAADSARSTSHTPTPRVEVKDLIHGVEVEDPYRWLEDAKSDEVQAWMKAQDETCRAELKALPERDAIAARLKQLYYIDTLSAPVHRGKRYFYVRRHADKEKSLVYWKEGEAGRESVLFDPNTWSEDGSIALGGWQPSWDGKTVAYQLRRNNSDEATLQVIDVASGAVSKVDVIGGGKYASASWTPRGDGFYYTWLPTDPSIPTAERPGYAEVRFHRLGQDPAQDTLVREKTGDPTSFLGASLSRDGRWLVLDVRHGWTTNDVYFRDLKAKADAWTPLAVGQDALYEVWPWRGRFYVKTNDGAPRWRLYAVDPHKPERAAWTEIVPERPDATLDSFAIVGNRLALTYMKDASNQLEIRRLDGDFVRQVALPTLGTVGGPLGNEDEDKAYFTFASYTRPQEIHQFSVKSGATRLYERTKVPIDPEPYSVEQVFFPSKDGTRLSMFLVHRKDFKKDGANRTLLYGYGGFQVALTPSFSSSIYPWLERGGVYAVANLRGGSEYGEDWHRGGMLLKKQNVFDDFIAAAEYLIREGYTRPSRLVIQGGSNGGLLVGAALTQRPDLYAAVVCAVPLLDMVRYHLYGSGKTWISEYGSADDAEQFKALYAYSPYHHVKAGTRYPAVLLLSADSDDRVDPLHARKFAAALQEATTGGPVWLRIQRHAGHGGADMVPAGVEQSADALAFALARTASAN